jgi:hypothetical protein
MLVHHLIAILCFPLIFVSIFEILVDETRKEDIVIPNGCLKLEGPIDLMYFTAISLPFHP